MIGVIYVDEEAFKYLELVVECHKPMKILQKSNNLPIIKE